MNEQSKPGEQFQKVDIDAVEAAVRAYWQGHQGLEAIVAVVAGYSNKAFEDATGAFAQLCEAKSFEQALEIQSQYVKKAYETHISALSKLSDMPVSRESRAVFEPVQLQDYSCFFGPEELDALTSAYDAAWQQCANELPLAAGHVPILKNNLAQIILASACKGIRDVEQLKEIAIRGISARRWAA